MADVRKTDDLAALISTLALSPEPSEWDEATALVREQIRALGRSIPVCIWCNGGADEDGHRPTCPSWSMAPVSDRG